MQIYYKRKLNNILIKINQRNQISNLCKVLENLLLEIFNREGFLNIL